MAEPFGIVAGAVGIAVAFSACVECFDYIQLGRHFGRDFQTNQLILDCARLCLTRWGESVNIYEDSKLGYLDPNPTEIRTATNALLQILVLFEDTAKISNRYKLKAKGGDDISKFSAETAEIKNAQELQLLEEAAQDVDKLLHAADKEARTGHRYLNVVAAGQAKVQNGDAFGINRDGCAIGSSHSYDGIHAEGNAKV